MSSPIAVFISNLKVLGFEKSAHCKGLLASVSLAQDMFTRGASNTKQFEATSHFLFKTLDKKQCLERFKKCWPIQEYMRHSREYRAVAYHWLEELKRSSVLMQHIPLRKSLFENCRGTQFEDIMVAFSTVVLEAVLIREDGGKDVDNTVLTLHSEQFSQRIQHDIQQAAKSFNEKSTQVETAKKEWHRQAREIILNLNEKDESSAFSSIKEIENRAQERVDQVMPKIGDLRAKFNQRQSQKENKKFKDKIYDILTTKQSENGIYILPPLSITKRKPFTLLRKDNNNDDDDDDDDEQTNVENVKESEFRRLFQTVDDASSLHKEPTPPHHDDDEITHVDQEQEEERRVKELVDQTARLMESTPLESSTAQSTNNTTNNNSSIYTTPPRRQTRWYMGSATSAVSPMFPAFGSVESIRHEQPPWTPDGPRQGGSELDLFELNNKTPIRSIWPPNQ